MHRSKLLHKQQQNWMRVEKYARDEDICVQFNEKIAAGEHNATKPKINEV